MEENIFDFKDIVDIYEIANDLLISLETTSPQGEVVLMYQIRYAFDHFIDALKLSKNSKSDKKAIDDEINRARGHLIRVIYDVTEIIVLRTFTTLHKSVRFINPKVINEVYSDYHSDYEKIYKFRDKLNEYKKSKSNDDDISVLKDLQQIVKDSLEIVAKFELKKKQMRQTTVRYLIWAGVGLVITAGVTFVITYFASRA